MALISLYCFISWPVWVSLQARCRGDYYIALYHGPSWSLFRLDAVDIIILLHIMARLGKKANIIFHYSSLPTFENMKMPTALLIGG